MIGLCGSLARLPLALVLAGHLRTAGRAVPVPVGGGPERPAAAGTEHRAARVPGGRRGAPRGSGLAELPPQPGPPGRLAATLALGFDPAGRAVPLPAARGRVPLAAALARALASRPPYAGRDRRGRRPVEPSQVALAPPLGACPPRFVRAEGLAAAAAPLRPQPLPDRVHRRRLVPPELLPILVPAPEPALDAQPLAHGDAHLAQARPHGRRDELRRPVQAGEGAVLIGGEPMGQSGVLGQVALPLTADVAMQRVGERVIVEAAEGAGAGCIGPRLDLPEPGRRKLLAATCTARPDVSRLAHRLL